VEPLDGSPGRRGRSASTAASTRRSSIDATSNGLTEAYWRSDVDSASSLSLDDARDDIIRFYDGGYGAQNYYWWRSVRRPEAGSVLNAAVIRRCTSVRSESHPI
jgi:hypothetical protein